MKKAFAGALCALALGLSACATPGINSFEYAPPAGARIVNKAVREKPFSDVWESLVSNVSNVYHVIDTIDRERGLIVLSFSTNSPEQYADCGTTRRTYTEGRREETFEYLTAASARIKIADERLPDVSTSAYSFIKRDTSMDVVTEIMVAPSKESPEATVVTVNAHYTWKLKSTGETYHEGVYGRPVCVSVIPESVTTAAFSTNTYGAVEGDIRCVSTGKLESEMLGLAIR